MKKILLIGKLNDVVKETTKFLSQYFHVQICSENTDVFEGMMKIVNPDLVLISLIGSYAIDTSIFFQLSSQYTHIPALTIGTKEESHTFFNYYEGSQFENLIRPVEHTQIFNAVCKKLGINETEAEEEKVNISKKTYFSCGRQRYTTSYNKGNVRRILRYIFSYFRRAGYDVHWQETAGFDFAGL